MALTLCRHPRQTHSSSGPRRNRGGQELRRSQALYSALAENPTYGICQLDEHGRLLIANEALAVMLGYGSQRELLASKSATELIPTPGARAQLLDDCRLRGQIDDLEVELTHKNGATITVRLSGRRIHDETAALEGCELIVEDITRQRALENHLRQLASTDPLTGLGNYRRLAEVLDGEIKRSERTGRTFAVLLFDLNGMKQINDRHGHLVGDVALRRMADAFRLLCRSIDTPARYGGDEFLIVLPETEAREARTIGRRICDHVACDPAPPCVSASMGVASYPRDGNTIDHLVLAADRALYRMKRRAPFVQLTLKRLDPRRRG
jgi:diguanylate cyclase (GGDEF)-like protein/PAS domain S-box-containing protein